MSCDGAAGKEPRTVTADVRNTAAIEDLASTAVSRFGRVDAVVLSAGALAYERSVDLPDDVLDATLTNLGAASRWPGPRYVRSIVRVPAP